MKKTILSTPHRYEAVLMYRERDTTGKKLYTTKKIAEKFKVSSREIQKLNKKYEEGENLKSKGNKNGRPEKTGTRTKRKIVREAKKNPFLSLCQIKANLNLSISRDTIARILRKGGRLAFRPAIKTFLNIRQKWARFEFARTYEHETPEFWRRIIGSDEKKFSLNGNDGHNFVWRPRGRGQRLNPKYVKRIKNKGNENAIHTGGCIHYYHGVGPLVQYEGRLNGNRYENEILSNTLVPFLKRNELHANGIFLQDNAPPHKKDNFHHNFFQRNEIVRFQDGPGNSPDCNPIENLWGLVEKMAILRNPKTKAQFWEFIQEEGRNVPLEYVHSLIDSLPDRIAAVKRAKGGYTRY